MKVPPEADGRRLDAFVAQRLGVSRAVAAQLVDDGDVLVDERPMARSTRLRHGQDVALPPRPLPAPPLVPEPGDLDVVYEDDDVIVVDKPAGLVVHPGAGQRGPTLAARLLARYPELASVGEEGRPGIVHRLDRDTSGLLCVARTPHALAVLQAALRTREVGREYTALVVGVPGHQRGTVDAPIGPDKVRRGRRRVSADGLPARTHYEVTASWTKPAVSMLRVTLETGRTHQIRVHLAAIDHAVAGDSVYGGRKAAGAVDALTRPFLHASRLALPGRPPFTSPLPPELSAVIERLGPPISPPSGSGQ